MEIAQIKILSFPSNLKSFGRSILHSTHCVFLQFWVEVARAGGGIEALESGHRTYGQMNESLMKNSHHVRVLQTCWI